MAEGVEDAAYRWAWIFYGSEGNGSRVARMPTFQSRDVGTRVCGSI